MAYLYLLIRLLVASCVLLFTDHVPAARSRADTGVMLRVLGTVQDGGSPHMGCKKACCSALFAQPDPTRQVVALGVADASNQQTWLFEATPDFTRQAKALSQWGQGLSETPGGIFLTHAHIGHYSGLMFLGKEAMNAQAVPVYTMPRMLDFLQQNGPWGQLVTNRNITLQPLVQDSALRLSAHLRVTPIRVPHRDEYSETVGFLIEGPHKSALFIPDIDKWEKWDRSLETLIDGLDYAFIDGTFYDAAEINYRNIADIPHPFIIESMARFANLSKANKAKIYFIHFNHTNPVLDPQSTQSHQVEASGFHIARFQQEFEL